MRIKSQWFKDGAAKTPQQNGSAMAFIIWRVAQNTLKRMRAAHFDIDVGPQYFAFTRELLVFLLQVADRMAYERLGADQRVAFVGALVRRMSEVVQDNEVEYLGAPTLAHDVRLAAPQGGLRDLGRPGVAQAAPSYADTFIDLFNELAEHYAEFGYDAKEGPDFGFVRYLGHRIEPIMPEKDRRWVIEQFMAAEVPEAVGLLQKGMSGIFNTEPRARRVSNTGD